MKPKFFTHILAALAVIGLSTPTPAIAAGIKFKNDVTVTGDLTSNGTITGTLESNKLLRKSVSLSAADLIAMYTTPVSLIAAPGAGKAIVVHRAILKMTTTSTQFVNGGAISIKYSGAADTTNTIAASVVNAAAGSSITVRDGLDATAAANTALVITNATAAFATGTGTAELDILYSIQ